MTQASSRTAAFLLLTALLASSLAPVYGSSGSLTVGARVVHYAKVEAASHAGAVTIQDRDVARGWVEVAEAISVGIRTNSQTGYRIRFDFAGSFATSARLSEAGEPADVTPQDPYLARSSDGPTRETLVFDVRLDLAPGTEPGVYFWPLEVNSVLVGN